MERLHIDMKYFAIIVAVFSIVGFFGLCWAYVTMLISEQKEFNELEELENGE